jgi:hypothetical protein
LPIRIAPTMKTLKTIFLWAHPSLYPSWCSQHVQSYARTHAALLDIENIFGHPALVAKVLVICSQTTSHAMEMAQDKVQLLSRLVYVDITRLFRS